MSTSISISFAVTPLFSSSGYFPCSLRPKLAPAEPELRSFHTKVNTLPGMKYGSRRKHLGLEGSSVWWLLEEKEEEEVVGNFAFSGIVD